MSDPYEWYRKKLAGEDVVTTTEPECGFYLLKSHYDGMLPASIYWGGPTDENGEACADQVLCCEVGGVAQDPYETWLFLAKRPIPKSEYDHRLAELVTGVAELLPF